MRSLPRRRDGIVRGSIGWELNLSRNIIIYSRGRNRRRRKGVRLLLGILVTRNKMIKYKLSITNILYLTPAQIQLTQTTATTTIIAIFINISN